MKKYDCDLKTFPNRIYILKGVHQIHVLYIESSLSNYQYIDE